MNNLSLSERAMLVKLNMSQWTARKYDKKISDKVADDYEAGHDCGRYNKVLVALDAVKAVSKITNEARTYHYEQTLCWDDAGARLLPSANYFDYSKKMQGFKGKFDAEVQNLIDQYEALVEDARQRLNGMFRASDYPSLSDLPYKYSFRVSVDPLPVETDFRVDLQGDQIKAIKADIENRVKSQLHESMKELWQRLFKPVKHMAETLKDEKATFKNSLVENLVDICGLLPMLNIIDDPKLEELRQMVERDLCSFDPEDLRKDEHTRSAGAREAEQVLSAMAGYTG